MMVSLLAFSLVKSMLKLMGCGFMNILIMGLPDSGKTYLAERLTPVPNSAWFDAGKVREMAND